MEFFARGRKSLLLASTFTQRAMAGDGPGRRAVRGFATAGAARIIDRRRLRRKSCSVRIPRSWAELSVNHPGETEYESKAS